MKATQRGFIGIALIVLFSLAIAGGGAYIYTQKEISKNKAEEAVATKEKQSSSITEIATEVPNSVVTKDEANEISNSLVIKPKIEEVKTQIPNSASDPWAVIEKYNAYIKARDLAGINSLSYNQMTFSCGSEEECEFVFEFLEDFSSSLNKNDFVHRWEDNKQVILTTDIKTLQTTFTKDTIIFAKDANGNLKLVHVASFSSDNEAAMTDSDKDGLTDQEEKCEEVSNYQGDCNITTGSTMRDSDGDGWWDGVEARFE